MSGVVNLNSKPVWFCFPFPDEHWRICRSFSSLLRVAENTLDMYYETSLFGLVTIRIPALPPMIPSCCVINRY